LLVEALMGTSLVVEFHVLLKNAAQMTLVHNQDLIETFLANGAHPTLCECIGPRGSIGDRHNLDALWSEDRVESWREFLVVVPDEKGFFLMFFLQIPD
jgi:hypothetical protein